MGGKRLIHNKSNSTIIYFVEKFWASKYIGDIVVGVVIGLIILIVTPLVNNIIESHKAQQNLVNNLSSISLGMSKNYIDGLFGQPIIESEWEAVTWYEDYQAGETFISAGYKLADSVLLCLYRNESLKAFVVVVNKEHLYRIPSTMYLSDCYLLDFTYADFSEELEWFEGNVPANNDDYLYYTELFYGAGPADYNYFVVGSYKDYRDETEANDLAIIGQQYVLINEGSNIYDERIHIYYDAEEHYAARKKTQPNVFGIVSSAIADEFNFVFQIVGNRVNGALLFNDWR